MHNRRLTRRALFQTGLVGSCGALAGWASTEPKAKPSGLTITKVQTFALQHKLPKAIGPSTTLYGFRDSLLVKITTDSGLVGWGETADVGGTRGIIEDHLKKILIGANPLEHRKLWRELWGANFGDG